ncbi:hypothetical protein [Streptomyces sp. NBC_01187]|uniref:hypothetical protein n=1 Tax=Streptomyces sp. NBC_01187 TaxID=2903766 RepID=UPI003868F555|nr:hypothetical protein OG220_16620 [Streptomyces sp. NBC_01187]
MLLSGGRERERHREFAEKVLETPPAAARAAGRLTGVVREEVAQPLGECERSGRLVWEDFDAVARGSLMWELRAPFRGEATGLRRRPGGRRTPGGR